MTVAHLPLSERLSRSFSVDRDSGCWNWSKPLEKSGRGRMKVAGRNVLAHRVSYEVHKGPIPDGLLVCHHCDNPRCVNPEHLFLGTVQDNSDDMVAKGRQHRHSGARAGAGNPNAKLTAAEVANIRLRLAARDDCAAIASAYGVSALTIKNIKYGRTWRSAGRIAETTEPGDAP